VSNKARFLAQAAAVGSALALAGGVAHAQAVPAGKPGEHVITGKPSRYGGPSQFRHTFTVPSLKTEFAIGGFVKFDAVYDMDRDLGLAFNTFTLPVAPETDGRLDFFAASSRLNFRTATETDVGVVSTVFEWDFFNARTPQAHLFNLRHAYGELDNWLFGQTWTNAWSPIGSVRNFKHGGMPGSTWAQRLPQIRYTMPMGKSLFAVALEDPNALTPAVAGVTEPTFESELPNLTARFEYGRSLMIGAIARQIELVEGDSVTGFGVTVQAQYPVLPTTTLKGVAWYGEGIASYVPGGATAGPASLRDAYVVGGELEAVPVWSAQVGVEQTWSKNWSSSFGYTRVKQDDVPVGNVLETSDYALASLWWVPTPRFAYAVELQWGENTRQDGSSVDASRIQTGAIIQF
jgi:hypothetical protein